MPGLLEPQSQPRFLAGDPSAQAAARLQNLTYAGGAITAAVGTLDYFFDIVKSKPNYCLSPDQLISRRQHVRTRVIGGVAVQVAASNFTVKKYPFVEDQTGQAGHETMLIDVSTGDSWVARRRGSMQDLIKAICDGELVPARPFYLMSRKGRTYGPFVNSTTTP